MPEPDAKWNAKRPIRPDQQYYREPIDRLVLLAGEDPGQPLHCGGKGLRNDRVVENQIASLAIKERANDEIRACVPRPIALQHSRQTVVRHGFQGFAKATQLPDVR
jgi:hypothetical protein